MASRPTLHPVRWMADHRPNCVVEGEIARTLNAQSESDYKRLLQIHGSKVYTDHVRTIPSLLTLPKEQVGVAGTVVSPWDFVQVPWKPRVLE